MSEEYPPSPSLGQARKSAMPRHNPYGSLPPPNSAMLTNDQPANAGKATPPISPKERPVSLFTETDTTKRNPYAAFPQMTEEIRRAYNSSTPSSQTSSMIQESPSPKPPRKRDPYASLPSFSHLNGSIVKDEDAPVVPKQPPGYTNIPDNQNLIRMTPKNPIYAVSPNFPSLD